MYFSYDTISLLFESRLDVTIIKVSASIFSVTEAFLTDKMVNPGWWTFFPTVIVRFTRGNEQETFDY